MRNTGRVLAVAAWLLAAGLPHLTATALAAETDEEPVDFDEEEAEADKQSAAMRAHGGGGHGEPGGGKGFKIFADFLVEYEVGGDKFEFTPHHTHVILQAQVTQDILFAMELTDDPVFYEMRWYLTPHLSLRAGKLLIPFGTNEFHHLIGGRVDESSHFLPEIWSDFGLALNHLAYDGEDFAVEYDIWAINGFAGGERPIIGTGTLTDNNMNKGIGARLKLSLMGHYHLIGSVYYDVWDLDDTYNLVFYSVGFEISKGFVDEPFFDRLSLRGEWARGEFHLPGDNPQQGILQHAVARAGFYVELKADLVNWLTFRFRAGRINPDNTVTDDGDLYVFEPAFIFGSGALTYVLAYQMTMNIGVAYAPDTPPDMLYAKFFLQY